VEILVHVYAYAGFPRALNGINAFVAVLDKRKEQGVKENMGKEATPIPASFDRTAYGHKTRNSLVGRNMSKPTGGYQIFTPVLDQFLVEHLFADIFYRDVLNYQERELVTISILAAMAGTEPQLKSHFGVSLNVGLTKAQLEEFVVELRKKVSIESAERSKETLHNLLGIKDPVNLKFATITRNQTPVKGAAENFTGNVSIESRFSSVPSDNYQGGIVNFKAGARTAWHIHPLGQTLIVISGRGLVQSDGDTVQQILPGDVISIPVNVKHWHGAAPDSPMSHVAISASDNGSTVDWQELVNDEQYRARKVDEK
jgi:quercetin dioxygenase-like cupin family protein/alkylhydroperoxidase/carboxymuconolactone decarboxylase family protein YurZ